MKQNIQILSDGRMIAKHAAEYLGFVVQTLAKRRMNGTGPKFVKRGRIFYYKADLDKWLKEGDHKTLTQRNILEQERLRQQYNKA